MPPPPPPPPLLLLLLPPLLLLPSSLSSSSSACLFTRTRRVPGYQPPVRQFGLRTADNPCRQSTDSAEGASPAFVLDAAANPRGWTSITSRRPAVLRRTVGITAINDQPQTVGRTDERTRTSEQKKKPVECRQGQMPSNEGVT
jgi:hypothetical protein